MQDLTPEQIKQLLKALDILAETWEDDYLGYMPGEFYEGKEMVYKDCAEELRETIKAATAA